MSVTNEIIQLFAIVILAIWLVAAFFFLFRREDSKEMYQTFDLFSIAVILFNIVAQFHLHNLVLATIMCGSFVVFTGYRLLIEFKSRKITHYEE